MTRPGHRTAYSATATALMLAAVSSVFSTHAAQAADSPTPKSAAECRAIADFDLRGKCWDALDSAGLQNQKVVKKLNFGLGPTRTPEALATPKPAKTPKAQRIKPDNGDVDALTLTIASVGDTPLGKILLTSTDGAVWEQTDSDTVNSRPSPGDSVEVSKGFLGGYMCQVTRWQSVRCQRDQ